MEEFLKAVSHVVTRSVGVPMEVEVAFECYLVAISPYLDRNDLMRFTVNFAAARSALIVNAAHGAITELTARRAALLSSGHAAAASDPGECSGRSSSPPGDCVVASRPAWDVEELDKAIASHEGTIDRMRHDGKRTVTCYNSEGFLFALRLNDDERLDAEQHVSQVLATWTPPQHVNTALLADKLMSFKPTYAAKTPFRAITHKHAQQQHRGSQDLLPEQIISALRAMPASRGDDIAGLPVGFFNSVSASVPRL
ncbi:hypothetical protein C8Q78DRAFT_1081431 [Trametes maxima]|nr:hypothetical protein C8Q78DRAFT_1081431 [Trametes maxima]